MSNIFFTSDTHAYHTNIAGISVSSWKKGYRDFEDEYQMTDILVDQINHTVGKDDILYHLGDWSFGGIDKIEKFRDKIKCKNIHLILGNHDNHIRLNKELPIKKSIFDIVKPTKAQELFTSVQDVKYIKEEKYSFFLSHYPHRVWDGDYKGVIHLYGHCHNSLKGDFGKCMDVGVDSAKEILGEYRPFHIQEIIEIMNLIK